MPATEVHIEQGPQIATYPPGATFGPRRLRDFEFVWMVEGDAEYTYETGGRQTTISAPQGTLLLCRNGFTDSFVWDKKRRTRHGFFHFKVVKIDPLAPPQDEWPLLRKFDAHDIFGPLTRYLLQDAAGNSETLQLTGALFLHIFLSGQGNMSEIVPPRSPDAVERALQFLYASLESEPSAPLTLDQLARAACVTPEHLCRVFKVATGYSPLETVRLARLDRAAVLLARSNYSVAQVAGLAGFASPFHFSRAFKAAYGLGPRELRLAVARGDSPPTPRLLSVRSSSL